MALKVRGVQCYLMVAGAVEMLNRRYLYGVNKYIARLRRHGSLSETRRTSSVCVTTLFPLLAMMLRDRTNTTAGSSSVFLSARRSFDKTPWP